MRRRQYLATVGAVGTGTLAGCGGLFDSDPEQGGDGTEEPTPGGSGAVYVPSHVEGMGMIGMAQAGRLRIALAYSFPHEFWLVNDDRTNLVEVREEDSVHLMVSVWDGQTERAIPATEPTVTVTYDGDTVVEKTLWPMLSQNMGFHYGDNVAFDALGEHTFDVQFGPVDTRRAGGFDGAFGEQATPSFSWEVTQDALDDLMVTQLDDREGEEGAAEPMDMDMMPVPQLPASGDIPGSVVGERRTGDATVLVTRLESTPAGVEGSGPYLAVSPRTPYNRYPLPFASLSATVSRGDETVYDDSLTGTLHPDLGFHYGAAVESLQSGDEVTVTTTTPPQVSRHEGYESAFLDVPAVDLAVE